MELKMVDFCTANRKQSRGIFIKVNKQEIWNSATSDLLDLNRCRYFEVPSSYVYNSILHKCTVTSLLEHFYYRSVKFATCSNNIQ